MNTKITSLYSDYRRENDKGEIVSVTFGDQLRDRALLKILNETKQQLQEALVVIEKLTDAASECEEWHHMKECIESEKLAYEYLKKYPDPNKSDNQVNE